MYYQCDLFTSSQVNSGDPEPAERLRKTQSPFCYIVISSEG